MARWAEKQNDSREGRREREVIVGWKERRWRALGGRAGGPSAKVTKRGPQRFAAGEREKDRQTKGWNQIGRR